jgi:hypothetical protein
MLNHPTDLSGVALSRHAAQRHAQLTALAERRAAARSVRRARSSRDRQPDLIAGRLPRTPLQWVGRWITRARAPRLAR